MVMSTDPQEVNDGIEFLEPGDGGGDTAVAEAPIDEIAEAPEAEAPDSEDPATEAVATDVEQSSFLPDIDSTPQEKPAAPNIDQESINELERRRADDRQREWRQATQRKAQQLEQTYLNRGYDPEHAREQANVYIRQERKFKEQETELTGLLLNEKGRQAAALHYMKEEALIDPIALEVFDALQRANTPDEMRREAKRIKELRALKAENTQLKQGRVAPQTFDNSQGSAEVSTNKESLMERYIRTGEGGEQIGKMFGLG